MIWCWSLLFGIFFNILKASMSSVPRMTFPIACMHDAADVISLNKKEDVRLTVVHHTQSWMMVLNRYRQRCEEKSCNTRTSVICQKTFDMSRLLKRNTKLYIKVKLEQNIHYSCPFTYLLYSGNSIQPIKVIQCWEPFSRTLHWPDTNFTLGVKFNLHKAGINLNDTNIFLRAGTCRNCFKMELPIAGNILEKTWQVNLPIECATRACLEYKPFFYTIQAFSGLYINEPSQAPCYVTFDIMDDFSRGARVTTCLRLSPKKYGVLPYDNKLLLVLKLDAVTYMEFTTGGLDDFWCLPDNWLRQKSTLTLQWKGGNYVFDKEPWTLHVKSNATGYNYYSSCNIDPYQEKNITFVSQEVLPSSEITPSRSDTGTVDLYTGVLESAMLSAGLCIAFVTVITIIVIVCVIRRRKLRATPSTNQNIGQMSQQRRPPNTTDNNTPYGLTQLEELTPVLPTAPPLNDTDQMSTDLDLPPPYPGKDIAPPSYEEVCQFLPAQSHNVQI